MRQPLRYTSGLPNYAQFRNPDELTQPVEAAELTQIALSHKPDFDAGKDWRYSNTGYTLAGMIVNG